MEIESHTRKTEDSLQDKLDTLLAARGKRSVAVCVVFEVPEDFSKDSDADVWALLENRGPGKDLSIVKSDPRDTSDDFAPNCTLLTAALTRAIEEV